MAFNIAFNEEKNQLLKATRRIGFDDVLLALKKKKLLADINHPSLKRASQKIYVVEIDHYAYVVPYVINKQKQEIYLKTIYPSKALTKHYLKKGNHEKTSKK